MAATDTNMLQRGLNGGLVGLVLLAVLEGGEDLYAYQIAKRLKSVRGLSLFKDGSLYPVLRALSAKGLLTSRIVPSYSGPPRRYYRITAGGRTLYAEWRGLWQHTRAYVDHFVGPDPGSG